MDVSSSESAKRPSRPLSNWAQIFSAGTSLVTVALAVYALFFSSTSQALVQYLQSELAYRNRVILNLQDTKENLEKNISSKEGELRKLDEESTKLKSEIASLGELRSSAEAQIAALKQEQSDLSKAVVEAASQSKQNEFSYIKERLAGRSEAVIVAPWVLTILWDENRTRIRREVIWPHYLKFYQESADKIPEPQRQTAQKIVRLFQNQCSRFSKITFEIPVPVRRISPDFERLSDPRIEKIQKKALDTEEQIVRCMRSVQDE
ncbi:hypothetical protein [Xanthobacter sp. 126]|uniref:hypothetical protein n=1 Tax=Xanthobacter sp. 126 TaxID=1131814 RepID=UPI0012DF21A8|nr:hypothetical protein [Xanthobacter sp. 126]